MSPDTLIVSEVREGFTAEAMMSARAGTLASPCTPVCGDARSSVSPNG